MKQFQVTASFMEPAVDTFTISGNDRDDAELNAQNFIRDTYHMVDDVEIVEIKEING